MIKLALKLAIVALIGNATWHVGSAYAAHYRFVDAIESAAQFRGPKMTDDQLQRRILDLAAQYDIPLTDEALTVRKQLTHTYVDGSYKRKVQLVPRFTYDWPFSIHTDTFVLQ